VRGDPYRLDVLDAFGLLLTELVRSAWIYKRGHRQQASGQEKGTHLGSWPPPPIHVTGRPPRFA